jgi:transglutaminase-like putative cysteine protease
MPPEDEVRSWGIFYYTSYKDTDYTDFWARIGGSLLVIYDVKDTLSPGKDSKKVIEEIINPKDSEDEKLRKIFDYTRAKIRNLSYDLSISDEEREKLKPNSSPEETLKKGQGFAGEINDLFATLAIAAGFEARVAFTGDRSEMPVWQ